MSVQQTFDGLWSQIQPSAKRKYPQDMYTIFERKSTALLELQLLLATDKIDKVQAVNMMKMVRSNDLENLVVAEEFIKNMLI
jgi:hypothetical protein